MEFTFYHIVSIVAVVFLILLLTMIGLSFSKSKQTTFPPSKNTCPDYWRVDYTNPDKPVCEINPLNMGTVPKNANGTYKITTNPNDSDTTKAYIPGFDAAKNSVDFSDPGWPASFSSSSQCSLKKWANKYEISWDGISNFNKC
jgi:hypothetical protein